MTPPRPNQPRRAAAPTFDHGLARAADAPAEQPTPARRPTGLPLLLLVGLGLTTAAGVVQVRARARALELGAEIAEMTGEHTDLLGEKRRLAAERAYLRHPDYIQSIAAGRLQMVPATPDRIQKIHLTAPAAGGAP
jgi:cell division protein FtsL